jgi:cell division protein FtsL
VSVPARSARTVEPARPRAQPARPGSPRPVLPRPTPHPTRTVPAARRAHHIGFFVLASLVIGSIVLGIVSLNVLVAQTSFRIDTAEQRVAELSRERVDLQRRQATLSAPGRIADWAARHGMRLPDDIRSLHAPSDPSAPAGPAGSAASGVGG